MIKKYILIIFTVFCAMFITICNAAAVNLELGDLISDGISSLFKGKDKQVEVSEISLGAPTSAEILKGSTLVIPAIIWHVYEGDTYSAMNDGIVYNVYNNIKTIPYLNNIQSTSEFSSNLTNFKTKYSKIEVLTKYSRDSVLEDILKDTELLSDAINLGILTKSQYIICTFFVSNGLLGNIQTDAKWYTDGTYTIKNNLWTASYLIVLDVAKNAVVHYAKFKTDDTYKLRGECPRSEFNAEFVKELVLPKNKEVLYQQLDQLLQKISESLRDNSIYVAEASSNAVNKVNNELVSIGLGSADAVKEGQTFTIYSDDDKAFSSPIAMIEIKGVEAASSYGKLIAGDKGLLVPGVIARAERYSKEKVSVIEKRQ